MTGGRLSLNLFSLAFRAGSIWGTSCALRLHGWIRHTHYLIRHAIRFFFGWIAGLADGKLGLYEAGAKHSLDS